MRSFLGANSERGFYSLYGSFPPADVRLHIIKGGPGCGKSGFMKKLAEAAEQAGEETERVLCSGDPDSLDGIWLKQKNEAWVDGTAPHAIEPRYFGIDSDYVNLGCFFSPTMKPEDCARGKELYSAYRGKYNEAYGILSAAGKLRRCDNSPSNKDISGEISKLKEWMRDDPHTSKKTAPQEFHRFLSAVSCEGRISLLDDYIELCKQHFVLHGDTQSVSAILEKEKNELLCCGHDVICAHDPLCPDMLEAVIVPDRAVAMIAEPEPCGLSEIGNALTDLACNLLREAKKLHDELELIYRPYMDFHALDVFTEREIRKLGY